MANFLSRIFSSAAAETVDKVGDVIDRFVTTSDEKVAAVSEAKKAIAEVFSSIQDETKTETEAKMKIIVAELEQGDTYTKRARPTVVYFGLFATFMNYILLPGLAYLYGTEPVSLDLPTEFWWAWGSVTSVYAIGRSGEKMGVRNSLINSIVGKDVGKTDDKIKQLLN